MFLATFSGLIYWQYGEKLASIFSPISQQTLESNQTQVEPGSAYNKLIADGNGDERLNADEEKNREVTAAEMQNDVSAQTGNVEIVSAPSVTPELTGQLPLDKPVENEIAENDSLITDWESAVSSLPDAGSLSETEGGNSNITSRAQSSNSSSVEASRAESNGQTATENTQTALTNPQNTDTALSNDNVNQTSLQANQWISANDYAIQMLAMKSESVLNAFLRENNLVDQTRIYKTERYGGDWFVVVFREVYPSLSQAQQTRAALPEYPANKMRL